MGEILKYVAYATLIMLILAIAIPLLWLVVKLAVLVFGSMFSGIMIAGSNLLWVLIIIASIIVIVCCISN